MNMWHLRVSSAYVILNPLLAADPTRIPPRVPGVRGADLLGLSRKFRNIVQAFSCSELVWERSTAMASLPWIAYLFAKREKHTFAHFLIDNPWERDQDD